MDCFLFDDEFYREITERFEKQKKESQDFRKDAPELRPGDNLYTFYGKLVGKFRRGSISGISRSCKYHGIRHKIRTTAERRANCAHIGYTRGKRRNIPTTWDDLTRMDQKWRCGVSWKRRKKTRFRWGNDNKRIVDFLV